MPQLNYDKFQQISDEIETECVCPHCGGALMSFDQKSLYFICLECGSYIQFDQEKNLIPQEN